MGGTRVSGVIAWGHLARRILQIVPTLLLITGLVFGLLQVTGGDPIGIMMGPSATSKLIEQVRHELDLDQPLSASGTRGGSDEWLKGTSASRFGPGGRHDSGPGPPPARRLGKLGEIAQQSPGLGSQFHRPAVAP